jgi:sRNA-binding carbon storage regulator CsrA
MTTGQSINEYIEFDILKMQINEIKNDIKIISLNKDSVKVGFDKQIKWFGIK